MKDYLKVLLENKSLLYGILTGTLSIFCSVLSIINACSLIRERKIKLSVSFGLGFTVDGKNLMNFYSPTKDCFNNLSEAISAGLRILPSVSIINHSKYTVYIDEIGLSWGKKIKKKRAIFLFDKIISKDKLTENKLKLEPYSSINLTFDYEPLRFDKKSKYVYVETSDQRRFFKNIRKFLTIDYSEIKK